MNAVERVRGEGHRVLTLLLAQRSIRERQLWFVGLLGSLVLITWVDTVTGRQYSFSVVYLLPVVATGIVVSPRAGYVMSVASAAAWLVARNLLLDAPDNNALISVWNCLLRVATISIIVFLIGALRNALLETAASQKRTEDFLATAAHQIRTPVAGVMASAEGLAFEADPARRARLTDNLINSSERLGRLLTALLELSRLDRSVSAEPARPADVAELCRAEVESAAIRFPHISFECEPTDELMVPINPLALSEAVANLLENAGRHAVTAVRLDLHADDDHVRIDVRDDGPGVPIGMEDSIFERFVAADGKGGSGLGLAIARGLVESQDGSLTYTGERLFQIELPPPLRRSSASRQADRSLR